MTMSVVKIQSQPLSISKKNVMIIFLLLLQFLNWANKSQAINSIKSQIENNSNRSFITEVTNMSIDDDKTYAIPKYTIDSIANLVNQLVYIPGLILIYDPNMDRIHVYSISHPRLDVHNHCYRCEIHIPFVVKVLWSFRHLSSRKKPIQIFLSESDFPYVDMESFEVTKNQKSSMDKENSKVSIFCPWIQFGSVPRNSNLIPNAYAFPFLDFLKCLTEWNTFHGNETYQSPSDMICKSWELPLNDKSWETLRSKLIWRGMNYGFLHTLTHKQFETLFEVPEIPFFPRRQLMEMSKNHSWINASWSDSLKWLSLNEQRSYKYHIDVGGAGGTSWTGTINKLAMPGLLFHHETPSKDWFYETLERWNHYIPIRTDLSDLDSKYKWAEQNQQKARDIARNATDFVRKLFSYNNLQITYEKYFGQKGLLNKILQAYSAQNMSSLDYILTTYIHKWNFNLNEVVICSRQICDIKSRPKKFLRIQMNSYLRSKFIRNQSEFGDFSKFTNVTQLRENK
jgi:hypothetical protein